jgi:cytochrome c peroxidase
LRDGEAIVAGFNYNNPVFFSFDEWKTPQAGDTPAQAEFRASVARGYDVFFVRPMWISDVAWFNSIGMGNPYKRTCAICHSVHLTGNDISPGVMDIGVNNAPTTNAAVDTSGLPLFRVTCDKAAPGHPYLGREFLTHDPGRALITGKCFDIGSLVMQQLRGLSARAPYFSNGSAQDLAAVVEFYDLRFDMKMTDREKQDLENFLSVL